MQLKPKGEGSVSGAEDPLLLRSVGGGEEDRRQSPGWVLVRNPGPS